MTDFVFRDGYLLRLYQQRDTHSYYRCSNRKNKCKVRLSINNQTQEEKITGEHLDTCVRNPTQDPSTIRRRKISMNKNELINTADGSPFMKLQTIFPQSSIVLFTSEMELFLSNSHEVIFELSSTFHPDSYNYFLTIFGIQRNLQNQNSSNNISIKIKPVAFLLLQEISSLKFSSIFNFIEGSLHLSKIKTVYSCINKDLIDFLEGKFSNVRLSFYSYIQLVNQSLSAESTVIIFQLPFMTKENAEQYLQNLRLTNPNSQILSFFDRNFGTKPIEFWNVSDDFELHKDISSLLTNYNKALNDSANSSSMSTFAKNLLEIEMKFRNYQNLEPNELFTAATQFSLFPNKTSTDQQESSIV